jgi:tRNA-specific 2-thiouridylase
LKFAEERGADFVATGHYVERKETTSGVELHRGVDNNKDQSYFLWSLSQEQLDAALFPVGDTPKELIRKEAAKAGIPTATKKDSQGVCFLGHIDIPEFLSHYVTLEEGSVLDESGARIGTHKGSLVYTLGQRHGFTLTDANTHRKTMFVVAKDISNNTITVSEKKLTSNEGLTVRLVNTVLRSPLKKGERYEAQFRYRQTPFSVEIHEVSDEHVTLTVLETVDVPAPGQSCVIYRGSHCIGGGIIA